MTPARRSTDHFEVEPVPKDLDEYRERSWHTLRKVAFDLETLNGTVRGNTEDITRLDKDITVARKLAWIALAILGVAASLGGLYAAFA